MEKTTKLTLALGSAVALSFIYSVATSNLTNIFDDHKIAENLDEYINHLSQQKPIKAGAPVGHIITAQMLLIGSGEYLGRCGADGVFGPLSRIATKEFQKKNNIPITGTVNRETLELLFETVKNNAPELQKLDNTLIAPFQTSKIKNFTEDKNGVFQWHYGKGIFINPMSLIVGTLQMLQNNKDLVPQIYKGCQYNHLRDAFRHAQAVYEMSDKGISIEEAEKLANIREKDGYNPPSIALMDVYNHHVAAKLKLEYADQGLTFNNSSDFATKAIRDGYMLTMPFPLVPKLPETESSPPSHKSHCGGWGLGVCRALSL